MSIAEKVAGWYSQREDKPAVAHCLECGAELEGRSDKEFCSDRCRKRYARRGPVNADIKPSWDCTRCGKPFTPDDFYCAPWQRHIAEPVAPKTYLLNDAPSNPVHDFATRKSLPKTGRTVITNIPPPSWEHGDQENGGSVIFENGRYVTSDPVEQYLLDARGGYCTEEQWEAAWLTPEELHEKQQQAEQQRLREEQQRLKELQQEVERLKAKGA